jgi:hypothetical protein
MVAYCKSLKKLSNLEKDTNQKFRMINEIASVNKWIRKAEKLLKFQVEGDWEFSEMAQSPYFRLRNIFNPPVFTPELPMTKWQQIKADPKKHAEYLFKQRMYEKYKRMKNK